MTGSDKNRHKSIFSQAPGRRFRGITFVLTGLLVSTVLCACGEVKVPDSHSISVDFEGKTGEGIGPGSTYSEFITAYKDYQIDRMEDDSLTPYTIDETALIDEKTQENAQSSNATDDSAPADTDTSDATAPADTDASDDSKPEENASDATAEFHDGRYMISAFYVDDMPVSVETILNETGLKPEELNDHLASSEYLAEHSVIYRYTVFTIENDTVTDVTGDYLDYNRELQ